MRYFVILISIIAGSLNAQNNVCTGAINLDTISQETSLGFYQPPGQDTAWFSFVPTGQYLSLGVEPPNILSDTTHFHNLTIYSGTCNNLAYFASIDLDSLYAASGRGPILNLLLQNLQAGARYFVRVSRPGNNSCVKCLGAASAFTLHFIPLISGAEPYADCVSAIHMCTNQTSFKLSTGSGSTPGEVPASCAYGNPGPPVFSTACPSPVFCNQTESGCLKQGEKNSHWIRFKVGSTGIMSFNFGAGTFYNGEFDWILYPYTTCNAIKSNSVAPLRCNWNVNTLQGNGTGIGIPPLGPPANNNYVCALPVTCGQEFIICMSNWAGLSGYVTFTISGVNVTCSPIGASAAANPNPICPGSPAQLNVSGCSAANWTWQPGNLSGASVTVSPTSGTTYTVTGTGANCCGGTVSTFVSVNMLPAPNVNLLGSTNPNSSLVPSPLTICPGQSAYLYSNSFGPGYTYDWQPGGATAAFITVTPSATTTYTVSVTNLSGCTATDTYTVIVAGFNISATSTNPICFGACNGTACAGDYSSEPFWPYTFSWSPGGMTTSCVSGLCAGTYTITATNSAGCTATTTVTLINPPPVQASASVVQGLICNGGSTTLSANAAGGTGPYSYSWQPAVSLGSPNSQSTNAFPTTTTVYTVTATDANGCTGTAAVTLNVFGSDIIIGVNNQDCLGNAFLFDPGTENNYTFNWDFGDGSTSANSNPSHIYSTPGIYSVTLTASGGPGCTASATALVYVTPTSNLPHLNGEYYNKNCCSFNYPYTLENYSVDNSNIGQFMALFPPNNFIISIKDTLRIKSGTNLILVSPKRIQFGPWGRVIIEEGARLEMNGAIFEGLPTCRTMWQGVEIYGTPAKNHSAQNLAQYHGRLYMNNGAIIQEAHIAITCGSNCFLPPLPPCPNPPCLTYSCTDKGGGYFEIHGTCKFRSNGMVVKMLPFQYFNRSVMDESMVNDIGAGLLLDPGYWNAYTSWQYPNPYNPYYAPANSLQRTGKTAFLRGVRQVLFRDNIFKHSEQGFETYNTSVRLLDKNGDNQANVFEFMQNAFTASYFNSTVFGNRLEQNVFENITGTYWLRINGGKVDQLSSNFINTSSSVSGSNGIILNNCSNFNVKDNQINKFQIGIYAINSGAGGGLIGYQSSGNVFTGCERGIVTFLNNQNLQIRCNQFSNNTLVTPYVSSWEVFNSLANQGVFPALNDRDPAGNIWTQFTPNSNHINSYQNSFLYEQHILPATVYPDVTLSPQPVLPVVTNFMKLTTSCDPCPPPCNNLIYSSSQKIQVLDQEYNQRLQQLDGTAGTQALLNAIHSNMSPGNLKNLLLANSYLSDEVLIAYINRPNLSAGTFKEVLLRNSPVSSAVRPHLYARLSSFPTGIRNQIKNAQVNFTNRTLAVIELELNSAKNEQLLLINDAVAYYLSGDTLDSDSSSVGLSLSMLPGTNDCKYTKTATELSLGNISNASASLGTVQPECQSEQDLYDLQTLLISLEEQNRTIYDFTLQEQQFILQLSQDFPNSLASVNACTILKLLFGYECELSIPTINNLRIDGSVENSGGEEYEYLGNSFPNPATSTVFIPYNLPLNSGGYILLYELSGKKLSEVVLKEGNHTLELDISQLPAGVYQYSIEVDGILVAIKKLVIIK